MRSRMLPFFAGIILLAPLAAHAAAIPFFGPIVPSPWNLCPGSWAGILVVINNIIDFGITIAIVLVAPLMIAYAGFLFVVNPVNPSGKEKAKSILWSTVLGIVVALAAWLIVNALMAVLYNGAFGDWSSLLYGTGPQCLSVKSSLNQAAPGQVGTPGTVTGVTPSGTPIVNSGAPGSACDPNAISQAAVSAGYTLTSGQAQTLACIAQPESSCGTTNINQPNYCWNQVCPGNNPQQLASSAAGALQVTLASNSSCYNNSVCEGVVGATGPLNCSSGFTSKGFPISGSSVVNTCLQAANNPNCSAAAAACLVDKNGSFSAWTADSHSSQQQACIAKYAGS